MILCKSVINKLKIDQKCIFFSRNLFSNLTNESEVDLDYICNPKNLKEIAENINNRKGVGDIKLVHELKEKLEITKNNAELYQSTKKQFLEELLKIPNKTHPEVTTYGNNPKIIKEIGTKLLSDELKDFQEITKKLKLVRTDQLGNVSGSKSYFLLGEMAELEQALIQFVVNNLLKNKFQLISVPDILHRNIIEGCGMNTRGTRTQVYSLDEKLHSPDLCLSGTSEMALAGFLADKILSVKELPLKLAAISRCYRAETSNLIEERGIYRVHEFTKVEMFVVTKPTDSEEMLEEIRKIQEDTFQALGLHFQVLDMPAHELGAQAYRKYDIEAWMAGRKSYGEISSSSNCLDYQSRRLKIKFDDMSNLEFVHTLNGTACAIPRLLITLIEGNQNKNGTITIPEVLQSYMGGKSQIGKQKKIPELKLIKHKI